MHNPTTRDRAVHLARKLREHAAGAAAIGSAHEAAAFAARCRELLVQHLISEADLVADAGAAEVDLSPIVVARCKAPNGARRRCAWTERLGSAIARAHGAKTLVASRTGAIWYVGTRAQTETCEYLWTVLARAGARLRARDARRERQVTGYVPDGYAASWYDGYVVAIRQQLLHEHLKRGTVAQDAPAAAAAPADQGRLWGPEAGTPAAAATPAAGALVVVDQALARVAAYVADKYGSAAGKRQARAVGTRSSYSDTGYQAGDAAGRQATLGATRGIGC